MLKKASSPNQTQLRALRQACAAVGLIFAEGETRAQLEQAAQEIAGATYRKAIISLTKSGSTKAINEGGDVVHELLLEFGLESARAFAHESNRFFCRKAS